MISNNQRKQEKNDKKNALAKNLGDMIEGYLSLFPKLIQRGL